MRNIAILGATGSIGEQALDVVTRHADQFRVVALTAHHNHARLFELVRAHRPLMAGLVREPEFIPEDVRFCTWVFGEECLRAAAQCEKADDVLVAVVGIAGLPAVLDAFAVGKRVLLANKEALVAGGALVCEASARAGQALIPVDSEHSAIFQCLQGRGPNTPSRLLLTASGGPFRTWPAERIAGATLAQALNHPNWAMGRKITIDSATMMNKALEVIEARWLFDMAPGQIEVVIHPQSIIHSMVEFADGAVIAQLGTPDMRLPILYAMSYPHRLDPGGEKLDFTRMQPLTFEAPDHARFPGLRLAWASLQAGGDAPAILNAANEVAVAAFLEGRIAFGRIAQIVEQTLQALPLCANPSLEGIYHADAAARAYAGAQIASA